MIMNVQRKYTLSDAETMKLMLGQVTLYRVQRTGSQFNVEECVNRVMCSLEGIYRSYCRIGQRDLDLNERQEITTIMQRITPELMPKAYKRANSVLRQRCKQQVQAVTAESSLRAALKQEGLTFQITCQQYRAKVHVLIPGSDMVIQSVILYKDVMSGRLDSYISDLKVLADVTSRMSRDLKVFNSQYMRRQYEWEQP